VFYPFKYQPVELVLGSLASLAILSVFVLFALAIALVEEGGVSHSRIGRGAESLSLPWIAPGWMVVAGNMSMVVSLSVLVAICIIVIASDAGTILGWQQAVDSRFPTFGIALFHLKQVAIPYLILTARRFTLRQALIIAAYFVGATVYSFTMGERVFFLETVLLIFLASMMRGWIRVSFMRLAGLGLFLVLFFMVVENAKQLIFSDTQSGDFSSNFSLFSSALVERFFAYYGDPAGKMQFVLAETAYFSDFLWFKESVARYLAQVGLDVDVPAGINGPYWESGYGGPILTNPGGFTTLLVDFGPLFVLPLLLFVGSLLLFYKASLRRSVPGACIYLMLVLSAAEMPRVAYFYWARFWLPVLFILLCFCLLSKVTVGSRPHSRQLNRGVEI
jgi:hypothetical protein